MTAPTITADDIIRRYADDVAHVAEETPAADLGALAAQLGTAARYFSMAGITGHEDVDTAATYLDEANQAADATERHVFLRKADELLRPIVWEMTQEYRDMVSN